MSADSHLKFIDKATLQCLRQSCGNQVAEDVTAAFKLLCDAAKHDRAALQQLRQQAAIVSEQLATTEREKAALQQNLKQLEAAAAGADASYDVKHVRRLHQENARLHQKIHDQRRENIDLQNKLQELQLRLLGCESKAQSAIASQAIKYMQESAEGAMYVQQLHLEAATMQEHIRQQEQLLKVQQERVSELERLLDDKTSAQTKVNPAALRENVESLTQQVTNLLSPRGGPAVSFISEGEALAAPTRHDVSEDLPAQSDRSHMRIQPASGEGL